MFASILLARAATAVAVPAGCWEPNVTPRVYENHALPPHPRLRLSNAQLASLNHTIASTDIARNYYTNMHARGVQMLSEPLVSCGAHDDLLRAARTALGFQYTLGLLYRLSGDARFAKRAAQTLLHVTTNCTTWDPFGLALAEMTHAVGIGYDWLYAYLSAEEKATIVAGVAKLGLAQALHDYEHGEFWMNCTFNWGVVTNGGLTVGALAFVDEAGDVGTNASRVIANAKVGIYCPFTSFAPDGGWHEGFMYWQYVAEYAQAVTEALRGSLGHDYGLSEMHGFNQTGLFRLHMNGPSQEPFDFGDASGGLNNSAASFMMGYSMVPSTNQATQALFAYESRRLAQLISGGAGMQTSCGASLGSLDCAKLLLDFNPNGTHSNLAAQPLGKVFRLSAFEWNNRYAIGFFRSGWSSEKQGTLGKEAWLAFKAPNGVPNHNDLDGGSFVFETGGRRWAIDLGADNYQLPNYFTQNIANNTRYNLYRKATVGHNSIVFNVNVSRECMLRANGCPDLAVGACAQDHTTAGVGNITLFETATSDVVGEEVLSPAYAIVNLSGAYALHGATRVERGFAFTKKHEELFVVDEFDFPATTNGSMMAFQNVSWSMHTMSSIEFVSPRTAVLRQGADALYVTVLEPTNGVLTLRDVSVELAPPQNPSTGVRKLIIEVTQMQHGEKGGRIVVSLSLKKGGHESAKKINALAEWRSAGPF